jgi:1-phosphatidylinositol-4-phosphate 5-kinase
MERRESAIAGPTTILPVVEEAAEGGSTGERSRNSHLSGVTTESDGRPLTPAKDGDERQAGFGNPLVGSTGKGRTTPTPPKTGYAAGSAAKPESADSGYGVTGANAALKSVTGSQQSLKPRSSISRESLDKALPPLPRPETIPQGVS